MLSCDHYSGIKRGVLLEGERKAFLVYPPHTQKRMGFFSFYKAGRIQALAMAPLPEVLSIRGLHSGGLVRHGIDAFSDGARLFCPSRRGVGFVY